MSRAIRCDRCGTCFCVEWTEAPWIRFMNPGVMEKGTLRNTACREKFYQEMDVDGYVDLCPECAIDFRKFMAMESVYIPSNPSRKNDMDVSEKDGV